MDTISAVRIRLLPALLAAIALLAGCGKEPEPAAAPGGETKAATAEQAPAAVVDIPETGIAAAALAKWTGDLDGMIERRYIRVLTTYSKTNFFIDQGTQRGLIPDSFKLFEDDLNKKLKNKHVRVSVVIVPVAHDDLVPALLEGRGDIVAAGKVVTSWRAAQVDFTNPTKTGISTIVVTGPGVPTLASPQDLSGREVYLRQSDVSGDAVKRFNAELAKAGKPPVKIRPAPEVLADEDLLEMVSAGLVPATIADDYIAEFWQQVFPGIVLNRGAAVRTGAETAMMVRKGSPQLLAELNSFLARYPEGSLTRNVLLQKYLKNVKYAKSSTSEAELKRFRDVVDLMKKYGDQYDLDYLLVAGAGVPGIRPRPASQEPCRGDRRHAGDAEDRRGAQGRRHPPARAEHPRGRQVHPLHDRPVLRERADGPAQQGAVRFRLIQRRTCAHPAAAREGRGPRPRPEQVVQQRRDRRGREHRPRDRAVRREYLQVLPCYQMAVEQMKQREQAKAAS
jgi:ABC-type amino acid transport substrate-binding protein